MARRLRTALAYRIAPWLKPRPVVSGTWATHCADSNANAIYIDRGF